MQKKLVSRERRSDTPLETSSVGRGPLLKQPSGERVREAGREERDGGKKDCSVSGEASSMGGPIIHEVTYSDQKPVRTRLVLVERGCGSLALFCCFSEEVSELGQTGLNGARKRP